MTAPVRKAKGPGGGNLSEPSSINICEEIEMNVHSNITPEPPAPEIVAALDELSQVRATVQVVWHSINDPDMTCEDLSAVAIVLYSAHEGLARVSKLLGAIK